MASETAPPPVRAPAERPGSRQGGWILAEGIRWFFRGLRDQWRELPAAAHSRWLGISGVGFALSLLLMWALTRLARHLAPRGLTAWEAEVFAAFGPEYPISFSSGLYVDEFGSSIVLVPVTIAVAAFAIRRGRPLRALSALSVYLLVKVIVAFGWWLWNRPRPTLVADGIAAPGLHSFPSGHVATTIVVYGFAIYLWTTATRSRAERVLAVALGLLITGLVTFGRLRIGSHWPSDLIAGAIVGVGWLAATLIALRRAEAKIQ